MAVITIKNKINNVNNFINDIKDSKNSYYCFLGKADPWLNSEGQPSEVAVIPANGSFQQIEQLVFKDMVFAKLLTNTDVNFMTKRNNWSNNTIYSSYDYKNANIFYENSYVITDANEVYKCIYNGNTPEQPNGVPSTVKPSITSTVGNFQTSDNYIWKYMYTCDPSVYTNFQTSNYIPVTPNNAVKENAVPGSIDVLKISNAGNNYQVFEEGFLKSYVNNYVVELPSTSSPYDDYYKDSQIYLKAGMGAGQIRKITGYDGLNKLLSVNPQFSLYENLKLQDIQGIVTEGDLVTQKISFLTHFFKNGIYNDGDILVQSDSSAIGIIRISNNTVFTVEHISNTEFFPETTPLLNTSYGQIQKSGLVSVTANSYYINSVSGTNFTTEYSAGQYIRIGSDENLNVRRITGVNTSVITVSYPFNNNLLNANNYLVGTAFEIDSITKRNSLGSVVYKNLDSADITFSNVYPISNKFTLGESVVIVDGANTSQGSNGTISYFANNRIILSDVKGPTINSGLYMYGLTSQTKAYIENNEIYPNITVETQTGGFYSGVHINFRYANGTPSGNAYLISKYSSPNELTEYIISPRIDIIGDGYGAQAYCTVDESSNNLNRSISSVILIDSGTGYTQANVVVSANVLYGSGAIIEPQISPINGHGSEPYIELGAIYAGISKKFDTAENESYKFPLYGSYRKVGVIKNPFYRDVIFDVTDFDRSELQIENISGSFDVDEILLQPSTNAAGIVTYSNNTYIELKNTKGTFSNVASATNYIYGLSSDASANCINFNLKYFSLSSEISSISELTPGGTGQLNQKISNTQIRLTDVIGDFKVGDKIYEPASNAYATIEKIYTANGTIDSSISFGKRINQTARITLTSNTKPFEQFEYVRQGTTQAYGMVISANDEIDIIYNNDPVSDFIVGDKIYNTTTGSNAVITYVDSNTKYLRLSAVYNGGFNEVFKPFNPGDNIETEGSVKTTTINTIYSVLVLGDVGTTSNSTYKGGNFGIYPFEGYEIIGDTSGAEALVSIANSIILPELKSETGQVMYIENSEKIDKTPTSTEQIKLIIKF